MAKNIEYKRRIVKRSTVAGQIPTIPGSNDHTDETWVVTDIYEGELFLNVPDGKSYTRSGDYVIYLNSPFRPVTEPVIVLGTPNTLTVDLNKNPQSIIEPRLSSGTRSINVSFSLLFDNWENDEVHSEKYSFTGTIAIQMPDGTGGQPNVKVSNAGSIGLWDDGTKILTISAGTDDVIEFCFEKDRTGTFYDLVVGGVAI